jgi:hypothetical protein
MTRDYPLLYFGWTLGDGLTRNIDLSNLDALFDRSTPWQIQCFSKSENPATQIFR